MTRRAVVLGLLLLGVLAGCVGDPPRGEAPPAADVAELPGCGPPPSPAPDPPPAGALIPPDTRVTAVRAELPVVQLNGYVAATPDDIRDFVESVDGVTVEEAGGNSRERELLVSTRRWRIYLKARAVCTTGSLLLEILAPADSDAQIPSPALPSVP